MAHDGIESRSQAPAEIFCYVEIYDASLSYSQLFLSRMSRPLNPDPSTTMHARNVMCSFFYKNLTGGASSQEIGRKGAGAMMGLGSSIMRCSKRQRAKRVRLLGTS